MERPYIPREHYLELIRGARDLPLIKVITGIRRCGKSTLMEMFIDELRSSGIPDERIFHINLDDADNDVSDHRDLLELVRSEVPQVEGSYLFFDEVQNVDGWEKAIDSFHIHDADVYITGSNRTCCHPDRRPICPEGPWRSPCSPIVLGIHRIPSRDRHRYTPR